MKKILFASLFLLLPLTAKAGMKTDALNVTTSSMTVNGFSYQWPSIPPASDGLCLSGTNSNPIVLSWVSCSGGPTPPTTVSYLILEDGTNLLLEDGAKLVLEQ